MPNPADIPRRCEICLGHGGVHFSGRKTDRCGPIRICNDCRLEDERLERLYGPWRENGQKRE